MISRSDLREVSEFATGSGEILGVEPQLNDISFLPLKEGRWLTRSMEHSGEMSSSWAMSC